MKIQIKHIVIALVMIALTGCQRGKSEFVEKFLSVCIDNIQTEEIKLSDLVTDCRFVALDNLDSALLNNPNQIAVSNDYILITDYLNFPAKLFSIDGKFIMNIGSVGKGPEEYLSVVSPYIDEKRNEFWLMRGGNFTHSKDFWLMVFNKEGKIIKEFNASTLKEETANSTFVLIYNNQIVMPGQIGSKYLLSYYSVADKKTVHVPSSIPKDLFSYTSGSEIYPKDGKFIFKVGETDTVYRYNPTTNEIGIELVIYTNKHLFDAEAIKTARASNGPGRFQGILDAAEGGYAVDLLGETDKYYMFFVYICGNSSRKELLVVEKDSQKASFVNLCNDFSENEIIEPDDICLYNNKYLIVHLQQKEKIDENDMLYICTLKKP